MLLKKLLSVMTISLALALLLGSWTSPVYAELDTLGQYSEYFHDSTTGLYWFDPGVFYGQSRAGIDMMATNSTIWNWATSAQVDALVGQSAVAGSTLEQIIGGRLTTIGTGGPRWVGYYAEADPDGWLAQSDATPDFLTMTASGSQVGASDLGAGAWLVSASNPTVSAAVLENYGPSGEFFHDTGTGFFWADPATFYGLSRAEVETWLSSNPSWRWASATEVYELLGKTSTDGTALDQIIGTRLTSVGTGGPRWVGFYDQEAEPNGLILQAGIGPQYYLLDTGGTQSGAHNLGAGAWLVNESGLTPVDSCNWGDLKALYR